MIPDTKKTVNYLPSMHIASKRGSDREQKERQKRRGVRGGGRECITSARSNASHVVNEQAKFDDWIDWVSAHYREVSIRLAFCLHHTLDTGSRRQSDTNGVKLSRYYY